MPESPFDARLLERLEEARARFKDVERRLATPEVLSDPSQLKELGQLRSALEGQATLADRADALLHELEGAHALVREAEDEELRHLAETEVVTLEDRLARLARKARELLLPHDPMDDRPAVVEIRAGAGGDEAGLFAADLMRMYHRLAERMEWSVEMMSLSEGIPGSVKEAIFSVRGRGAYGKLRFESGVHRVQRVPDTESQGRIHTSAASVAVLPEAEEVDVRIEPDDLRIDVFRSSGPGGQSVNTTDSAVRVTHVPTGLVVSCQDEKSQHKNKAKALKVLRSRLLDREIAEKDAERAHQRRTQIGSGDRSAKIRTYNFPQNRVTDHRIGLTLHGLESVLGGDLDELIASLRLAEQEEALEARA